MFRKWTIPIAVTVLFILCQPSFIFGNRIFETQAYAQTQPSDNSAAEEVKEKEGLVSLDFMDTDIRNILKILALKSGYNIVTGSEVVGTINIHLQDVPWQKALEVVLQTNGYVYEKKGNIIIVTTAEKLKKQREDALMLAEQEPLETRTFSLNFAKAADVIQSVQKMKSERGNVHFDERTNTIIVTDTSSKVELMTGVIKTLDATTPQVLIESKIVETTLTDTENLGIDWVVEASVSGAARPTIFPFTTVSDNRYVPDSIPTTTAGFTYGTLNFAQVSAVFEALKSRSDTNILSSPRIVTLDNQTAEITVGSQYPIPNYTYNEDQAKLQVSGWEYKDIGIIFNVTPHINQARFVTLDVEPKITAILDYVTVENTSLPRLSNESSRTRVMVKDGETLVIGGLIKSQTTDINKKVPLVGDVPLLGLLFQKKEKTETKTDLVIFITPHIITPELPETNAELANKTGNK